ncbi:MAG: hypothetical protein N3B16_05480 [Candidatus Aminicenantes bacterium]|nr:hypothetical protein [Candidatus Aminicenantes bacterium]
MEKFNFASASFCFLIFLFISIPFLITTFPPITDLPQHMAQVRLFGEAISGQNDVYRINWLTPYSLPYILIGIGWTSFGALNSGRFTLIILATLFILFLLLLIVKRKRPLEGLAIATVFFFSHILYWGFLQFLLGWIIFLLWFYFFTYNKNQSVTKAISFSFSISALLYFTHILWLIMAAIWSVTISLIKRQFKKNMPKFAGLIPFIFLGLIWYPSLASYGFKSETIWATTPFQRLSFAWLSDAALGGLRGTTEPVILLTILAYLLLALWQNRKKLSSDIDLELLYTAFLFFFIALTLPDKHTNTIRFCQRWIPPAFVFFIISLPEIRLEKNLRKVLSFSIFIFLIITTSFNWKAFEHLELSGLKDSLKEISPKTKLLGLSFTKESEFFKGRPFIQTFAYAQVLKGGELNFSFADFGPSLVIYKNKRRPPWTIGLEWFPELVKRSDFPFFDYVLVNGDDKIHQIFQAETSLYPLTNQGRWRLYKVKNK